MGSGAPGPTDVKKSRRRRSGEGRQPTQQLEALRQVLDPLDAQSWVQTLRRAESADTQQQRLPTAPGVVGGIDSGSIGQGSGGTEPSGARSAGEDDIGPARSPDLASVLGGASKSGKGGGAAAPDDASEGGEVGGAPEPRDAGQDDGGLAQPGPASAPASGDEGAKPTDDYLSSGPKGSEFARGGGMFDPGTANLSAVQNLSVAVFIQVGNYTLWKDMAECLNSVVGAQQYVTAKRYRILDVYVSFVSSQAGGEAISVALSEEQLAQLEASVKDAIGPSHSFYYQIVENRGADIGQFLQQLVKAREMFPNLETRYDLILKQHTKTDDRWRGAVIEALCGNPVDVLEVMVRMMDSDVVNIMGTAGLVSSYNLGASTEFIFRKKAAFSDEEVQAMERVWKILYPEQKMIVAHDWLIIAGSCFWVKGKSIISERLIDATPELLASMPLGYKKGACCQASHALERLFPSMVQATGEVGIARWGMWKNATPSPPVLDTSGKNGSLVCRRRKRHGVWKWECTKPNKQHAYFKDKGQ